MQNLVEHIDRIVLTYLSSRVTLIAAVVGTALMIWGIASHNLYMVIQVILAGAMGYSVGFVPAVVGGLIVSAIYIVTQGITTLNISSLIIEVLGCTYIAWLGRQHKVITKRRRTEIAGVANRSHTVSWTFVNEVRNSLLAMRLLLFRKANEGLPQQKLELIENELLRLESMFGKLKEDASSDTTLTLPKDVPPVMKERDI